MFFRNIADIWLKYHQQLLIGLGYTMLISVVSTLMGLVIGLIVGVIRAVPPSRRRAVRILQKVVSFLLGCYIEVFRGTPMMVQAMVIYWGFAFAAGGQTLPLLSSAILIVSINTGAYIAEIVRGGIISVSKGQFEGSYAVGMTYAQTMLHVVIPQVLRNILPAVGNEFVINIKDTSVLNVIGVVELYYQANVIARINWQIFQTYAIVCVMYLIMTFTVTRLLRLVEKLLNGRDHYKLSTKSAEAES